MTMEETDALCDAYWRAAGAHVRSDGAVSVYGLLAVAAKAREMDAARGGTLSVGQLDGHIGLFADEVSDWRANELLAHLAAQGRTIAAKDARIAELEKTLADAKRFHTAEHKDRRATESALATLRQAFRETAMRTDPFDDELCWCSYRRSSDTERHGPDCLPNRELLAATPAEHPDTAMLREVTAEHDALKQAAAPYLTHDGESWVAHVDPDPAATLRDIRKQSLVDMALKGTVPTQRNGWPTTPPDVVASEDLRDDGDPRTCFEVAASIGAPPTSAKTLDDVRSQGGTVPTDAATHPPVATPTPEEDWRTVEKGLQHSKTCVQSLANAPSNRHCTCGVSAAREALARLKDAPRRAAEEMRGKADVAVLMLKPPASLLCQCETVREADMVRSAWTSAINAAVDAIRALEVTP